MNFYKRHLGDYAKDAGHLSMLEHGAYTLLLDRYYTTEAPILVADVYRITRARLKDEMAATDAVLREFFSLADGVYRNKRADEEIAKASHQRAINQETGKKGGRPRKETEQEPNGNRIGLIPEPINNPSQTPDSRQEQKPKAPAAPAEDFRAVLFGRWKALPESGGGSFLNKLFRDHKPEQRVVEAVERTLEEGRADPKAFVLGVLRREAKAEDAYDDLMRGVR